MARLLIKFTKTNTAKYISHLDTMRTLHRAFRRAALPISYSQGFNPHASISVAAPLSLGIASLAEYADVELQGELETGFLKQALNEALPRDIRILQVQKVNGKAISAMAAVSCAKYSISFIARDFNGAEELINGILAKNEIKRMKRTKSGEKLIDIRPMILSLILEAESDQSFTCQATLQAGSNGSLGADLLAKLIQEEANGSLPAYPQICREEIYTLDQGKMLTLSMYFNGK